jgi:hypothetical protein
MVHTAATLAPTAPAPLFRRGWVRNPLWDGFFMLSGLWLAPIVWVLARGRELSPGGDFGLDGELGTVYLVLTAGFWVGHRVSSSYLAYCTSAYRPLLSSQRTRFVWVPIGIAVGVFAFLVPEGFWPWPRTQRVMWLWILDYGLVTYHFASQHYGILSLYRLRAGQPRNRFLKRMDRLFALGVGGLLVFVAEAVAGTVFFQDVWLDPFVDPDWLFALQARVQVWGTGIVVVATVGMLVMEARSGAASLPRTLYMGSVSLVVLTAFWVHPLIFVMLWTVQHWTAAMGLATVVARKDPDPGPSAWYRLWHWFNRRPFFLLVFLMAVSTLLLPVMEVEAAGDGERYADQFVPWLMDVLTRPGVVPFLIAAGLVTAFLHYQLDRAVFRFSDPEVREAAGGALLD